MADDFKLPGSSFQEVSRIIQGYASLGKASSLADVSKAVGGMDPTSISRNTGFLVAVGILEAGKNKGPTTLGMSLGNALTHDQSDEVKRLFAQIVTDNEFLKGIVSAIRIRKGMDDNSLRSHIAYSASAKKGNTTTAGSGTVIEILQMAGAISTEDGKYVVGSSPIAAISVPETTAPELGQSPLRQHQAETGGGDVVVPNTTGLSYRSANGGLAININVEVSCNASDLDTLGEKLNRIIKDLERKTEGAEHEGEAEAKAPEG